MPSRWCRSRPRWSSTAARIKEARLALGGVAHKPWRDPAAEAALRGQAAEPAAFAQRGRCAAARRQGLRAQRLQDRPGAPRHRSRADAGRERHAAIAVQQENPVSVMTTLHRHATSRVDGRAKVTGAAKYAGEFNVPGLAYGSVVASTIAKGRIARIDASAGAGRRRRARRAHPREPAAYGGQRQGLQGRCGAGQARRSARCMTTRSSSTASRSRWSLAEEWEIARFAATLVRVEYEAEAHVTDLHARHRQGLRRREAREAARRRGEGLCGGRGAPRGRIFHSDRASQ